MPALVASSSRLLTAVAGLLTADPSLSAAPLGGRVYKNVAPRSAVYPLVILDGVTAPNESTVNGHHVLQRATFQVTVRDKGGTSTDRIEGIAEDVLACLMAVERLVANGLFIAKFVWLREIPRAPGVENNVVYPQLLSEFRAEVRPA
jgi:hypothetical protein